MPVSEEAGSEGFAPEFEFPEFFFVCLPFLIYFLFAEFNFKPLMCKPFIIQSISNLIIKIYLLFINCKTKLLLSFSHGFLACKKILLPHYGDTQNPFFSI